MKYAHAYHMLTNLTYFLGNEDTTWPWDGNEVWKFWNKNTTEQTFHVECAKN